MRAEVLVCRFFIVLQVGLLLLFANVAHGEQRIKDVSAIQGVRSNQLIGYGLIVGLEGTGDTEEFTKQTFSTMMSQLGVTIPQNVKPGIKNVAAVALYADLPAFAKPGQYLDVTVSSIGNAKSLRGGTLLMTPLKGVDGEIYAVAQGSLVVGGVSAEGNSGSRISVNVSLVGRIPNGAIVEKTVPSPFTNGTYLTFNLNSPDFTTSQTMAQTINHFIGAGTAKAMDAASVRVSMPAEPDARVAFVSAIENLNLESAEGAAKIIVNSRTGTIVINKHVEVGPAAISHGNITVAVAEKKSVSQPNPLSKGETVTVPESQIEVFAEKGQMFYMHEGVSLSEIVSAVNQVGASPGDLMAILEALKQAGALHAELQVI